MILGVVSNKQKHDHVETTSRSTPIGPATQDNQTATATPVSTPFNKQSTELNNQYKLLAHHKNKHQKHHQPKSPNPRPQPQFHVSKPYNTTPIFFNMSYQWFQFLEIHRVAKISQFLCCYQMEEVFTLTWLLIVL